MRRPRRDTGRPAIEIALENRTTHSLWTYQTDDGRLQEPLHQSQADSCNEWERTGAFGFATCVPPMEEEPEIPAVTTLHREIHWPPEVPLSLIVQVGYGYARPDFDAWMGGSELQWARVFEWQHVAASPSVLTGR